MKRYTKWLSLLLAGVLSATSLLACQKRSNDWQKDPDKDETESELISPETLYDQMLDSEQFRMVNDYIQTYQETTYVLRYDMHRDGNQLKVYYTADYGEEGFEEEINYCDLDKKRYYYQDENDKWVYEKESDDLPIGTIEDYIVSISPMEAEVMFEDRYYEEYDPRMNRYVMKQDKLLEYMGVEEEISAEFYMTVINGKYAFILSYEMEGVVTNMKITVAFEAEDVVLPGAKEAVLSIPPDGGDSGVVDPSPDPEETKENPYVAGSLNDLLSNLHNVTEEGMLDHASVHSIDFYPWENEGVEYLFDGVKTYDQWYYDEEGFLKEGADPSLMEGGGPGKCAGEVAGGSTCFIFALTEAAEVAAYVLTTGNDNELFPYRNPISWTLYGSNDPAAYDCTYFGDVDWQELDYVWDGGMSEWSFTSFGYTIDSENRGSYRYYCLRIEYCVDVQFQLGELELYVVDEDDLPEVDVGEEEEVDGGEPYTGSALNSMLEGKTNVVADLGLLDYDSIHTTDFYPWAGEGPEHLFDGIKTYDQWYYDENGSLKEGANPSLTEGGGPGKCAGEIYDGACFFFALEEEAVLSAYVLTTGNDNSKFPYRNPYEWSLYGTNDPAAAYLTDFSDADWTMLDYSRDGSMREVNFTSFGYTIDPARQGSYRYYCLMVEYCVAYQFQLGELELYVD